MPHEEPWDPGLQVERTTLAWLRTIMAFVTGMAVLLRLIAHRSAVAAALSAAVFLPVAGAIAFLAWRRHRRAERNLRADEPLPDGLLHAGLTALSLVAAATALIYALVL